MELPDRLESPLSNPLVWPNLLAPYETQYLLWSSLCGAGRPCPHRVLLYHKKRETEGRIIQNPYCAGWDLFRPLQTDSEESQKRSIPGSRLWDVSLGSRDFVIVFQKETVGTKLVIQRWTCHIPAWYSGTSSGLSFLAFVMHECKETSRVYRIYKSLTTFTFGQYYFWTLRAVTVAALQCCSYYLSYCVDEVASKAGLRNTELLTL
jgi:hypothetical protein